VDAFFLAVAISFLILSSKAACLLSSTSWVNLSRLIACGRVGAGLAFSPNTFLKKLILREHTSGTGL
jgi:hypothetical protein